MLKSFFDLLKRRAGKDSSAYSPRKHLIANKSAMSWLMATASTAHQTNFVIFLKRLELD